MSQDSLLGRSSPAAHSYQYSEASKPRRPRRAALRASTFGICPGRSLLALFLLVSAAHAQPVQPELPEAPTQQTTPPQTSPSAAPDQSSSSQANQPAQSTTEDQKARAEEELKREKTQRILGVVPNFNTVIGGRATPLSPGQKFDLAFHSALDPAVFGFSFIDAGFSEAEDSDKGYGHGPSGYFKRFGASYADSFSGTMLGNAIFPILLHQDPRYYRKGVGPIRHRFLYAIGSTVICKGDNGNWQPNFSNVLGNFAAGGISNLYYPADDRGFGQTTSAALTVTAEGALGSLFVEFWPDVSRHVFHRHPTPQPPTAQPAP